VAAEIRFDERVALVTGADTLRYEEARQIIPE